MMLYPPVAELVEKVGSRYQLVNLVARRARTLSAEAEEHEISPHVRQNCSFPGNLCHRQAL